MIRAFAVNRSKVEAQRELQQINAVRIGSGRMKKEDANQVLRELREAAGYGNAGRNQLRTVDQMRAAGVEVIFESPEGGENS